MTVCFACKCNIHTQCDYPSLCSCDTCDSRIDEGLMKE